MLFKMLIHNYIGQFMILKFVVDKSWVCNSYLIPWFAYMASIAARSDSKQQDASNVKETCVDWAFIIK